MKTRTIMVAIALSVPDDVPAPVPGTSVKDLSGYISDSEDVAIVSVLDRYQPRHNYEPQIFAAYKPVEFTDGMNEKV